VEYRILGPLEVHDGTRLLELGGAKQRSLLAVLLLNANQVVSTDHLIDALWDDIPPGSAGKAIQVYISQLRRILGKDRVQTKAPGYLVCVDPDQLDIDRCEVLLEQAKRAEPEVASAKLREALMLWRGRPLGEFAYESFAQADIARLEERRLVFLEERIEADLRLGRHAELVGELEALVAEHPLREHLRVHLMISLYRSGRQAEALEVYQDARTLLLEELGIEPANVLRELEQAILRHDPALEPERPAPAGGISPATVAPFQPEAGASAREVRKTVTVVLAEVRTTDDVVDPECFQRVTARSFDEIRHSFERHGASVANEAGGAMTAIFGMPLLHEDDALRAVRAAAEIRERFISHSEGADESTPRLELRVGVSTGEIVAGGTDERDVVGQVVGVAARLQQAARPDEILIAPETNRLIPGAVLVEPSAEVGAPSLRLLGIIPGAADSPSRFDSPIVGRRRERQRLRDAFEQAARDGSCQLFTILGAAGVGKSRLVRECLDDLRGSAIVARGRCLPYGEGITYWPIAEAVKDAAALNEGDSPERIRHKFAALLDDEDGDLIAHRIAELIGVAEPAGGAEERFWAVRTFFEVLARRRPLVLVFDDVHWGQATFFDLVEHIADWTREVPLLVVCIARPELLDVRPGWGGGKLNATAILLEPLSEDESSELIDNLAATGLEDATRRSVIAAAEGNPLFVEEMLALALEGGHPDGALKVPPTIQALLAARLDLLPDVERLIMERASVEGKVFHETAVGELMPNLLRPAVSESLAALVRKELIRPCRPLFAGDHAFRFRHLLIRDAAYDSIPKGARSGLHERHAAWLESKAGERIVEYEEIIGYHLEQAFRYRSNLGPVEPSSRELAHRAAERLGAAGRRAFARSDAPAAVNLISRAAALLPADDPMRVDLVPNVRVVQGMSGNLNWAERILTEALETGDARLKAHALVQHGFLRLFTEPEISPDELIDGATQAGAVFKRLGDDLGLARVWRLIAQAHYLARRGGACADASEEALRHALRARDSFEVKEIVEWLAIALTLGSTPAPDALTRCEHLMDIATGDRFLEVTLLSVSAYLEAMQGDATEAKRLLAAAGRAAGDPAFLNTIPYFSIYVGLVDILTDAGPAAESQLRAGCKTLEALGEKTNYCSVAALLARVLCNQGLYPEALELTSASEKAARANDVLSNVMWRSVRATVHARHGELDKAESLAQEAVAFAARSDFLNVHGDALVDLAEVLRLAGRPEEADRALENAVELYEQKGNIVSAASARSLLATHT
jgi:DNA-binding SARP family transcriptional activator/class 3 adenylate cyclase/tetratricopeptide (TPR) repeat protein